MATSTVQELMEQAAANLHWVDFGPFKLAVNAADGSGKRYRDETRRDELTDPLMRDLIARVQPAMFLDLGANFGFTAMLHHHLNPSAAIVAVEMSPLLAPFIRETFEVNKVPRATVVHAACGAQPGMIKTRLNLFGSHDNRVVPTGGQQFLSSDEVEVPVVSVDQLLSDIPDTLPLLIKVDTQGYERHVFAGAAKTLARCQRWAIKTEFGPDWLKSQGTDAATFLGELVEQFDVAEWPLRPRFKGDSAGRLLESKLRPVDVAPFVDWLAKLDRYGRGWCDLLVAPKSRTW